MLSKYLRLFTQTGIAPATDPLIDVSLNNEDQSGVLINFNYLYIAQHYPFVNLFMLMDVVNDQTSKFKIEYWDGQDWRPCVDVIDGTSGLKKTGMLQFSLRNNFGWQEISQTDDDSQSCPSMLKGKFVNNCYWLRVSFDTTGGFVAPNVLTKIKKICYSFTTTACVNSIDVEAPSYYDSVRSGATDWIPEIIQASEEMVLDLKRVGFIKTANQIIEFDELYLACAWKTLSHIYFQLGKAYNDNRVIVNSKYEKALSSKALTFDTNKDGKLDKNEINTSMSRMIR